MRGVCSIDTCEMYMDKRTKVTRKYFRIPNKIHEEWEWAAVDFNINICWHCGDKLFKAIKKEKAE